MEKTISINIPADSASLANLKNGQKVYLNGTMYTARDQAHIRMLDTLEQGLPLPIPMENSVIYYCGPSPARPDQVVGSIGPTTSSRMDKLTIPLLEKGLKIMIGKGDRSEEVCKAIKDHKALYLSAFGGAGALYQNCIKSCQLVAYPELMSEAIYKLEVENFPAVVVVGGK